MLERLGQIQIAIARENLEGWLLASAGGANPIAEELVRVDGASCRRRWLYFIPADGLPALVAHRAESGRFPLLPGDREEYESWGELREALARVLPREGRVAMECSPMGVNPDLARVDAGTIELIRTFGVEVVGSDALVQALLERLSETELDVQAADARALDEVLAAGIDRLRAALAAGDAPRERELAEHVASIAAERGIELFGAVTVAFAQSTADPTYSPPPDGGRAAARGDLVRIEARGRAGGSDGAVAVAGRVLYAGAEVPGEIARAFAACVGATDLVVTLVRERMARGRSLLGLEVDRVARDAMDASGLDLRFAHRTAAHLGRHGPSARACTFDGLELPDARALEAGHAWELSPGAYCEDWGVRVTALLQAREESVDLALPLQRDITALFAGS